MKKFLATLLTVAMVLSTMSFVAMADDTTVSVWNGIAVDTSWYNAAETEYVINSAAEFAGLAELVNNGETKFNGKTVKLAVDIDLDQHDWTPIGSDEADTSFRGNFDGQGHTISNLLVSKDDDYLGLFGYAGVGGDQGVVYFKDLTLNNATVISTVTNSHAGSYVGGVCANARVCTFNNVDLTGEINIQGYGYVGGIVGHSYATMTDCDVYAYGSINCNYWGCGALIGYMGEGMKEGIKNCTVISDEDNGGLGLWSAYGGIGAAAGLLEDDSTLDSVSVKDVSIDSNSDYCVGYISGGNSSTNSFVENIDVRVNGVEHTPDDANATLNPVVKIGNKCYATLQLAVDSAAEGDTIKIIGDITAEEATSKDDMIVIDKDITISGSTLAKTAKTLTNVAFNVKEGSKVKFDSLNFAGMSYIYVDNADVTVNNCYADVNLKQLIGNNVPPSFIAMSGSQDLNKNSTITLTNNTIVVTSSVHQYPNVIGGWNLLDNLTITGNTLGSEEKPYNWAAIKPMNYTNGATVNISNNTIYGSTAKYGICFAIQLSHQNSRDNYFVATIDNNKCINIAATELSNTMKLVDIDGNGTYISPRVNVTSSNTLNGAMVTMNNINVASSKVQGHGFVGMDLELDENGFLTGGYLNSSIDSSAYLANGYTAISYADGVNKVVKAEYLVDTVYVEFEDVTTKEGEKLYNVNLKAAADEIIYRLNSADLTFALSNDKMAYEVIKVDDITVTTDADYENRYMFNFNGKDAVDDTKNSITIAQIKVTGYGTFDLAVDNGVDTNVAYATKTYDNIVDTFIVNGSASGLGTLDISNKVKDAVITVPTRKLTVNVTFPNTVVNKVADFQKMTVTISGADFTKDYALGNNEGGNAAYVVTEDLTLNNTYTVTVKGDGYRTARYTVTMTEAKTLNFWNNVMDKEIEVEEGKASSAVTKNFLAGDIVADNNINIYDLSAVVSYFTESSKDNADYIKYDLNRDGVIDSKDVAYVLVSWGN